MYEAAKHEDLQVVHWVHSTTAYSPFIAVEYAAHAGHLAIAQWLVEHAHDTVFVRQEPGRRDAALEVMVPFDVRVGIFAWFTRNTDKVSVRAKNPVRRVHRSGFAFQGKKTCVVSVVSSSFEDAEKLRDPVVFAAEEGDIELLEVLKRSKDQYNWSFAQPALVQAVKNGSLEALQWLLENEQLAESESEYSVAELVTTAMDSDHVDILKWLDSKFDLEPVPFEHVRCAVQGGRLEVVVWAYERFPDLPTDEDLLYPSVGSLNADIAMWLHENKGTSLQPHLLHLFVKQDDVDLLVAFLKFLSEDQRVNQLATSLPIFEDSCEYGGAEVVRYLAEKYGAWSEQGAKLALARGRVDIAKWIFSTGRPSSQIDGYAVEQLARQGEWDLLVGFVARDQVADRFRCFWKYPPREPERTQTNQYAIPLWGERPATEDWEWVKSLVRWTLDNCPEKITPAKSFGAWACRHGHSDIVRRLIKVEYPTIFAKANLKRIMYSTRDGNLVQEFIEHSPELLDYRIVQWTAKHNQHSLLNFLFTTITKKSESTRVNFDKSVQLVVTKASKYGHLGLLKWLHLNVPPGLMSPWMSARHGQVHILEWLHESGAMDESKLQAAMQASVQTGQLCVLKWYQSICKEYRFCLDELRHTLCRRDVEMVGWILQKQPDLRLEDAALSLELDSFVKKWSVLARDLAQVPRFCERLQVSRC